MKKLVLISCFLAFNLYGENLDIKSNSEVFNKNLVEIKNIKESINSSSGREGAELNKYFHWEVLPNAFSDVIKIDDSEGFKSMLKLLDELNIDINSFSEENSIYSIAKEIIDNNSINCMKVLTLSNFNFKNKVLDKNYNQISLLDYARNNGASEEIISLLDNLK